MTARTDAICKVTGKALNYSAKQLVNFDVIKDMFVGSGESIVMVHTEKKIERKRKGELWPLSPNPRIRRIESLSLNVDL